MNLIFVFCLFFFIGTSQDKATLEYVKSNAIEIKQLNNPSEKIINLLYNYKLIMFGEIHGTSETSEFIYSVIEKLSKTKKIIFAIELEYYFNDSILNKKYNIANDSFFLKHNDARSNCNWVNLINRVKETKNVSVFFIEPNYKLFNSNNYDSLMYISLNNFISKDTSALIISLTGNYHNRLISNKFGASMGYYFYNCSTSHISKSQILSINNVFLNGAYYKGNKGILSLIKIKESSVQFSKFVKYKKYFILFPNLNSGYNGFLYTEKIHPAYYDCSKK